MPFIKPFSWEEKLFEKWEPLVKNVNVPLYDDATWVWMPQLRRALNRLTVATWGNMPCGPHGTLPEQYPVISKPVYNLYGSSIGVRVFENEHQYLKNYTPGHFWMPLLRGEHLSTDILIYNREVISMISARGVRPFNDFYRFYSWELLDDTPQLVKQKIRQYVAQQIPLDYCGALNVETIGNDIIEVGGRFSTQFCQFYSDEWFRTMCCLYQNSSHLHLKIPQHTLGWSFPVWSWIVPHDFQMFKHPKIFDTRNDCVNDVLHEKRIAIINTETQEEGEQLRAEFYNYLELMTVDTNFNYLYK